MEIFVRKAVQRIFSMSLQHHNSNSLISIFSTRLILCIEKLEKQDISLIELWSWISSRFLIEDPITLRTIQHWTRSERSECDHFTVHNVGQVYCHTSWPVNLHEFRFFSRSSVPLLILFRSFKTIRSLYPKDIRFNFIYSDSWCLVGIVCFDTVYKVVRYSI